MVGISQWIAGMLWKLLMRSQPCRLCSFRKMLSAPKYTPFLASFTYTTDNQSNRENKKTVEKLYKLSVDIRKIRRLKGWVLLEDETYVEEIANILQQLGADETAVASILERCPEAIKCSPPAVNTQRELWQSVCKNKKELVNRTVSRIFLYCSRPGKPEAECPILSRVGIQKCGH